MFRALALEAPDEWCTVREEGKRGSLSLNSHLKTRPGPAAERTFQPSANSIWAWGWPLAWDVPFLSHPRTGLTPGQTSALKSRLTSAESLPQPLQMGTMSPHPLDQSENPASQKGLLRETRFVRFWQAAPPLPHPRALPAVLCPAMTLPSSVPPSAPLE